MKPQFNEREEKGVKVLKKDLSLLQQLRSNARISLTEMSKKTRIPISTLFERLKINEKHLITKHTSILNFKELGFSTKMQVLINVPIHKRASLESYLLSHECVNSLYSLAGNYHFLAETIFRDLNEAQKFMNLLEKDFEISNIETNFVSKDLCREKFFSAS
jgi:DNA-binding Lrp family transcriptional regulator